MHRVLITGITGRLGQVLQEQLTINGFEVLGFSRTPTADERIITCDLTRPASVAAAFHQIPRCQTIIHAAARTLRDTDASADLKQNQTMTQNLLDHLPGQPHFIQISSVAVYGEAGREQPITVDVIPQPSGPYGRSKLAAEQALQNSRLTHYNILRVTPVYSAADQSNLQKRVHLPGTRLRLQLHPEPRHSFCRLETLTDRILRLLQQPANEPARILNVCDPEPHRQHELLKRFTGPRLACPVALFRSLYYLFYLWPGRRGYHLRCLWWKLFETNLYE